MKYAGPLKHVEVSDLADVVVLAGPNGVGKTHINTVLLGLAQNPQAPEKWIVIQATCEFERQRWGNTVLDTRNPQDAAKLTGSLQRNQRRSAYQSSFLNFDSDRAIRNIQSFPFGWDIGNPLLEDIGWNLGFTPLYNRFNDVRHSLFRMVESQRRSVADQAFDLRAQGAKEMELNFPDVLKPFKDAFWQLLAPKKLVEANVRDQKIYYEIDGQKLDTETLSSGEKEVMNIVFDFLLRKPKDCIIVFDEPELHLHPELSYKLLQTLARSGERNQFIFATHSPEIISASLENTVIFIRPPSGSVNQAVIVHRDDDTYQALKTLGQSIGVISLGKKLVLIEGAESSLDKQTYGAILRSRFPEFILVPSGGKDTIRSFAEVRDNILDKTIWGVDFFLLCDRDAANSLGRAAIASAQSSRIKLLPRYHLENYFLDATILASCFADMEADGSWLRQADAINAKILEIARDFVPYAVALNVTAVMRERVGNISVMPKGVGDAKTSEEVFSFMRDKMRGEVDRVKAGLDEAYLKTLVTSEYERLNEAVKNDDIVWKTDLPGRPILNKFASLAAIQPGRLKQLYIVRAQETVFGEIVSLFEAFRNAGSD
jgi:predicted ATPase